MNQCISLQVVVAISLSDRVPRCHHAAMQKAGMIRQLAAGAAMTLIPSSCGALARNHLVAKENSMGDYSRMLEWIDFPEGRVRYAGGSKGRDEPPIDVFSVEIGGHTYFGEIRRSFLADGNNYNIEIVSFGWTEREWFGTEPDPRHCATFSTAMLRDVQVLVVRAVPAWRTLDNRPIIVRESSRSHFMGEVVFRDGWALIRDENSGNGHRT